MAKAKAKAKATSGKRAERQSTTEKGEIVMNQKEMEKLIQRITSETLKAILSQVEPPAKETPKKSKKTVADRVSKPNPVKVAIEKEQAELALAFKGKEYGSQSSTDFIAFYRQKDNGSYTRIGHFNVKKGLFWFTKKSVTFRDWAYIKAQLVKYSNAADFSHNADRFARAGVKCPSDFGKVSWETFLNSGVFC